jgi:mono/diheme cytochrome c family protein
MKIFLSLCFLLVCASLSAVAQEATQPHNTWSEASSLYWLIANVVLVLLLAFAIWALYGKMRHGKHTNLGYHALGALVLSMTFFALILYIIPATQSASVAATDRAWDWQPEEVLNDPGGSALSGEPYRGYLVYLANGCTYCHTLYLRDQDIETGWGEGARPDEVSQIGDYVNYPFTMLGTQRDGPDLTITGRKIADMTYQIDHLVNPRLFRANSIMPSYRYLNEEDLQDLAAFLVSLGNKPSDLREGNLQQPENPVELSALAEQGKELYRSKGCVGCHTVNGEKITGPTWQGLYMKSRDVNLEDNTTISVLADEAYLREAFANPGAQIVDGYPNLMPAYDLPDEEIQALIEYIKSLSEEN